MASIEDRIRASLQERANDVEPTPVLWQEVDRRIARRRWRTVGVWSLAGVTAVLAALAIVPGLLAGPTGPQIEPGTGLPVGPGVPATVVVAREGALSFLDLASGAFEELTGRPDDGTIVDVAVRPGSTREVYDVAAVRIAPDGVAELVFESRVAGGVPGGGSGRIADHAVAPGFVPQLSWSPEGVDLLFTVPADADGAVLAVQTIDRQSFVDRADAQELAVIEADARVLAWVLDPAGGEGRSLVVLLRPDGDVIGLQLALTQDGRYEVGSTEPVDLGIAGDAAVVGLAVSDVGRLPLDGPTYVLRDGDGMPALQLLGTDIPAEAPLTGVVGSSAEGVWLDAAGRAALVGDGQRAWLLVHDGAGSFSEPDPIPGTGTAAAFLDRPAGDGDSPVDDGGDDAPTDGTDGTDDGGDAVDAPGPVITEPLLTATQRQLLLREADGTTTSLYVFAEEGESSIMGLAVRPGSTLDDLTAVVLTTAEGMWDLRHLRVADGEVTRFEPLEGIFGPAPDAGQVHGPVWFEDGTSLAWIETRPDGSVPTLRTIGWTDDGPGTSDPATDNAAFELADAPVGIGLRPTAWFQVDEGRTEITAVSDDADEGWYALPVERQGDGAWAQAAGGPDVVARGTDLGLPGTTLAVAGTFFGDPGVALWAVRATGDGPVAVLQRSGPPPLTVALPADLLPGEGLPTVWAHLLGDGSRLLVGSPNTGRAYVVDARGEVSDPVEVAWAGVIG